jgi:hypothetical protein
MPFLRVFHEGITQTFVPVQLARCWEAGTVPGRWRMVGGGGKWDGAREGRVGGSGEVWRGGK